MHPKCESISAVGDHTSWYPFNASTLDRVRHCNCAELDASNVVRLRSGGQCVTAHCLGKLFAWNKCDAQL